jgi:hypothetical protein
MAEVNPFSSRSARFHVGDQVKAVGPSARRRDESGYVTEIVGPPGDAIYRYRVRFSDGTSETFFGFELEIVRPYAA